MVHRKGIVLHAHLYAARNRKLVRMKLRTHSIFLAGGKNPVSLLRSEEVLLAENVNEIRKSLSTYCRDHLFTYKLHIVLLPSRIGTSHSVSPEKSGLYYSRRRLLDTSYHPEYFQLIFGREPIAAFYLNGACSCGNHLIHPGHRL